MFGPMPLPVLRLTKLALVRAYEAMGLRAAVDANLDLSAILNAADTPEQDQFEERCVTRAAERATRAGKSDRALWMKELEAAFPGKVADARTLEEYANRVFREEDG